MKDKWNKLKSYRPMVFLILLFILPLDASDDQNFPSSAPTPHEEQFSMAKFFSDLERKGVQISSSIVYDENINMVGGLKRGTVEQGRFDTNITLSSDPILNYPGGTLFFDFWLHRGSNPSTLLTGDLFVFDNLTTLYNLTEVASLWYEQKLGPLLTLKFGKMNASSDFDFTVTGNVLLNNAFGTIPTILGFPTYPTPTCGAILTINPKEWLFWRLGLFDGTPANLNYQGPFGPKTFFSNLGSHALILSEWEGLFLRKSLDIRLGVALNTMELHTFNGGYERAGINSYFSIEGSLSNDTKLMLQGGGCNGSVSSFEGYFGAGFLIQNLIHNSNISDQFAVGIANGIFSKASRNPFTSSYSTALEATYNLTIYKYFQIQPDLQWIINPSGMNNINNDLVFTIRLVVGI